VLYHSVLYWLQKTDGQGLVFFFFPPFFPRYPGYQWSARLRVLERLPLLLGSNGQLCWLQGNGVNYVLPRLPFHPFFFFALIFFHVAPGGRPWLERRMFRCPCVSVQFFQVRRDVGLDSVGDFFPRRQSFIFSFSPVARRFFFFFSLTSHPITGRCYFFSGSVASHPSLLDLSILSYNQSPSRFAFVFDPGSLLSVFSMDSSLLLISLLPRCPGS